MNTRRLAAVILFITGACLYAGSPFDNAQGRKDPAYTSIYTSNWSPGSSDPGPEVSVAPPPWLTRLSLYIQAVQEHRPGMLDTPARLVAFQTDRDLEAVRADFFGLLAVCQREINRSVRRPASVVYNRDVVDFDQAQLALGLTEEEIARGNANRVLLRAAIFHADIAMLVIPLMPDRVGCAARGTVLVKDGNRIGTGCIGLHWIFGRILLDGVRPDHAASSTVRLWYHATLAHMLELGNYADADPHIEHGRMFLSSDSAFLFEHGFYHEAFAAPFLQAVAPEAGSDLRSAKAHMEEAESLYRKALREDPRFVEARVHHGLVLGQLGRHGEAAEELRQAVPAAAGSQLRYYAALFLGYAEESLGNRSEAGRHYQSAAALYPQAQSPLLALAMLARGFGDRAGAQDAMRRVLTLPAGRAEDADPWHVYRRWQSQSSRDLFARLYAPYLEGGSR